MDKREEKKMCLAYKVTIVRFRKVTIVCCIISKSRQAYSIGIINDLWIKVTK